LLAPIRERVDARDGWVEPITRDGVRYLHHAPTHGVGMWWMECNVCGATWVGPVEDECGWCLRRYLRAMTDERVALLTRRPHETQGEWAARLVGGLRRGVISRIQMERAIRHAGRHDAG
jgi:hypothetical protein